MSDGKSRGFITFPKWANILRPAVPVLVVGGAVYATLIVWLGFSPTTTDVGMPRR